jgi:Methyltransferase domain
MSAAAVTSPSDPGFDPAWLALREPADHDARAESLLEPLLEALGDGPLVVHDLGSGTGSMARWLAPRLPGPQRWVLHDHDPVLLAEAVRRCAELTDATGQPVRIETRTTDLTRLRPADLSGATLVTASALLDLLTAAEVDALARSCAALGCAALLTLSVAGRVELYPPGAHDGVIAAAFDAHQRRTVDGRVLLGPDAAPTAVDAFARRGLRVQTAAGPWRLGPERAELMAHWLRGWVAAAVEQQPHLRDTAAGYLNGRLGQRNRLTAVVGHHDLLAVPAGSEQAGPSGAGPTGAGPTGAGPTGAGPSEAGPS